VLSDTPVAALKTGMLADAPTIRAVAAALARHFPPSAPLPPLVLDPVCVSTSGHTLLAPDALAALEELLAPRAALLTPNAPEAEALLARRGAAGEGAKAGPRKIAKVADMLPAARELARALRAPVLLKGGHVSATGEDVDALEETNPGIRIISDGGVRGRNMEVLDVRPDAWAASALVVDVLARPDDTDAEAVVFVRPRIDSKSTHGTGCTLSAAIACFLACGLGRECPPRDSASGGTDRHP
jgi:hydroxymethylpyrimidine/phosphomethylpyrimidine kinase